MFNKVSMLMIAGVVSSILFANQPQIIKRQLSPEEKQRMQQTMLERTGGLMVIPGKGKMLFINTIGVKGQQIIEAQLPILRKMLRANVQMTNGVFATSSIKDDFRRFEANALVYLVSDPESPITLIAPESKWGIVNSHALAVDHPSDAVLRARIRKSLLRTMVHVLGGSSSINKASAMRMAASLQDLDVIESEVIATDNLVNLFKNLPKVGMSQNKLTTYRKACEEGWAPMPTNNYQRAICDQVKADKERGPRNPLKIEPAKK